MSENERNARLVAMARLGRNAVILAAMALPLVSWLI